MADKRRGSSRNRGYTPHWEKIRAVYLSHHPLCERCESLGVITPAVLVHHRIRLVEGGTNDNTNLMALCYRCHEAIHTEQNDYKKV
jgi:5-methylcytosine-specific restriction protein A